MRANDELIKIVHYLVSQLETANAIGSDAMHSLVASMHALSQEVGSMQGSEKSKSRASHELNNMMITAQFFDRQTQQIQHAQKALVLLLEALEDCSNDWPSTTDLGQVIKEIKEYCYMPEEVQLYNALLGVQASDLVDSASTSQGKPGDIELFE